MIRLWAIALALMPLSAFACESVQYEGASYTICRVDATTQDIRLFLTDPENGSTLGTFRNVDELLEKSGEKLTLAMNAGMYHSDRRPVGHYVENGEQQAPLITADGPGNFGLLPNGVFCVQDGAARVVESRRFEREAPACRFATQSGPMLQSMLQKDLSTARSFATGWVRLPMGAQRGLRFRMSR